MKIGTGEGDNISQQKMNLDQQDNKVNGLDEKKVELHMHTKEATKFLKKKYLGRRQKSWNCLERKKRNLLLDWKMESKVNKLRGLLLNVEVNTMQDLMSDLIWPQTTTPAT